MGLHTCTYIESCSQAYRTLIVIDNVLEFIARNVSVAVFETLCKQGDHFTFTLLYHSVSSISGGKKGPLGQ